MTPPDATGTPATPVSRRDVIRRDVLSAYVVTGARVAAWAIISAIIYRRFGGGSLAMLVLVRGTIGLLSYTSIGLGPAMVRKFAEADQLESVPFAMPQRGGMGILARARDSMLRTAPTVYSSGTALAVGTSVIVFMLSIFYGMNISRFHIIPVGLAPATASFARLFGFGMAARLLSEAPASILQVRGRMTLDNCFQAAAEFGWLALTAFATLSPAGNALFRTAAQPFLGFVGLAFFVSSTGLCIARFATVRILFPDTIGVIHGPSWLVARGLLAFGIGVAIAQAADFLYSPIDCILINRLIGADTVAVYAPAVQLDSGLLLVVTGLATALLPHSAVAHAAGDRAAVRRFYIRGTILSLGTLTPAAVAAWLASPLIFQLWLGSPMLKTQAILPLVLFSTIVGGSSAVGRSILLSMGKVRAFSASVIIAGLTNVILSYVFVRYCHLGLPGIIYGTIVAVFLRCAVWMPWYVRRSLKWEV